MDRTPHTAQTAASASSIAWSGHEARAGARWSPQQRGRSRQAARRATSIDDNPIAHDAVVVGVGKIEIAAVDGHALRVVKLVRALPGDAVADDSEVEPAETVLLMLSNPQSATLADLDRATLTIADDDGTVTYLAIMLR